MANESVPQGWTPPEGCKVIRFEHKRQVLRPEEYKVAVAALEPMVSQMLVAFEAERVAKVQTAQVEGDEEHFDVVPDESDGVDASDDSEDIV